VVGCRMVLVFGLFVGLGAVPLWTLVQLSPAGLDLGPGFGLGALLGYVALHRFILRLGSVAAWLRLAQWYRAHLVWTRCKHRV
jgi:hypothetical protein